MRKLNTCVLITSAFAMALIVVPSVTAQEAYRDPAMPQWYDSRHVLCCGVDFDEKVFCKNVRRQGCWAYRPREVYDCKECKGAHEF
jgi:hypothetical protein